MLILSHLLDLALVLALLALCAGVGRLALGRLGFAFERPLEALSFSTAGGGGLIATAILIAGWAGVLSAPVLGLLLLAGAAVARRELAELPSLLARCGSALSAHAGVLSLAVFAAVGLFLISQAAAPPADWDSLMYHLRVPGQFLERGRVYLPEDNPHTAFVQLAHMLYLPLLAVGSPSGPALLNACTALLLGLAAFAFCARFLGRATAEWTLALLWGSTLLVMVAITPRVDVTLAWYLFLAHYALLAARDDPSSRRFLYLAGALLGFAFGVKYHALAYALALSPLVLWVAPSRAREAGPSLRRSLRSLAGFGLPALAAAGPWWLKNWILFRAPLYPFLAERRLDPWLARIYGGEAIPASVAPEAFEALAQVRAPFNLLDLLWAPGRLTVEAEGAFYFVNPILLALPLWVLFRRERTLNALLLPALGYLAVLLAYSRETNTRYLIPALAPLTIVAVHMIVAWVARFRSPKRVRAALLAVTALALLPTAYTVAARFSQTRTLAYLAGTLSREDYLLTHPDPEVSTHARIASVVNRELPEDARILMLLEARGYYFERDVLQDNLLTNWPLLAPKASAGDCLRSSGVTHLLVSHAALAYYVGRGLDARALRWDAFPPFAERCLTPAYRRYGFTLYRLRP